MPYLFVWHPPPIMTEPRTAPGPRALPLLGHAWPLRRDVLGTFVRAHRDHGAVVRLLLGSTPLHLVSDPGLAREVLQGRASAFDRATRSVRLMMDLTGESLLTTDGAAWARRRRLAGPAFHPDRIAGLVPAFARATEALLDAWSGPRLVEMQGALAGLTFRIVSEALFSSDVDAEVPAMERAQSEVLAHYWRRMGSLTDWPHLLPTRSRSAYRRGLARIRGIVDRILVARTQARGEDLLEALLAEARGGGLTDGEVRNDVLTLLLAGHETTSVALTWTLGLLARHPEIAARLRQEAEVVLGSRPPTAADLPRLAYTKAVFQEALRLHPPIWVLERRAIDEECLGGFRIPKGTSVLVSPYVLHRDPAHWKDPERFDPERFLASPAPPAYLPFGLGPHTCLGMGFAMTEALVILPLLLRRFEVRPVRAGAPAPEAGLTLRVRGGLPIHLHPVS